MPPVRCRRAPSSTRCAFVFFVLCLTLVSVGSAQSGGPDSYGYTWQDSTDQGGPAFDWVDITALGTEVVGLTDDNAVGPVDMTFDFPYYWSTYGELKIGSNGWLSFANPGNVAHCFPTLPTPGGAADLLLAPLMSDLIFTGAGNTAQVFQYYDVVGERFIVSFHNVPFWSASAPGWVGSNTFQVILELGGDIVFQYQDVDQEDFTDSQFCSSDVVVGLENQTGNIGLQVLIDTMPADGLAIRFTRPETPLIDVPDVAPIWTLNDGGRGVLTPLAEPLEPFVRIESVGSTDIATEIDTTVKILDSSSTVQYQQSVQRIGLDSGSSVVQSFPTKDDLGVGTYSVEATTTNSEDINPGNNASTTELVVIDTSQSPLTLGYSTEALPDGALSWQGGGGAALYIEPPYHPIRIDSVRAYVLQDPVVAGFDLQILDATGANGLPGQVLATESLPAAATGWQTATLNAPVTITHGGFYVAWMHSDDGVGLGTTTVGPASRNSFEFLGSWAEYRHGGDEDFLLTVEVTPLIPEFQTVFEDDFILGNLDRWSKLVPASE